MTLLTGKSIDWAAAVWDMDVRFRASLIISSNNCKKCLNIPLGARIYQCRFSKCHRVTVLLLIMPSCSERLLLRVDGMMFHWELFQQSLNPDLQSELACKGKNWSFSDFVTLTIKINNLMRQAPKRKNVSISTLPTCRLATDDHIRPQTRQRRTDAFRSLLTIWGGKNEATTTPTLIIFISFHLFTLIAQFNAAWVAQSASQ